MDILEISKRNELAAWKVIEETNIIPIWQEIGATVNLVGSLKSGLMMKNRDIDFHLYTDNLCLSDSFSAIARIASHPSVKEIQYKNLINTEACLEWHVWYEDAENNLWQLDLIHFRKGSQFDGLVERVTDAIIQKLTPEIKQAILQIKFDIPDGQKIQGIEIYRAVMSDGVRSYQQFLEWQTHHPKMNNLEWMP